MQKTDRIFVAGHRGLVGSAICRVLNKQGYSNVLTAGREVLPLDNRQAVEQYFTTQKIDYVFLAAAKVGGIVANNAQKGDFIRENLLIQTHVIDACYRYGIKKLFFLGSSCVYPKNAPLPIQENALLTGPLEQTNDAYAIAKIAGIKMCDAYREQYGFEAYTIMPCNVYGIGDNFHPQDSHIIPGLMGRFHKAKIEKLPEVAVWGTGKPWREFIAVDDLADACVFVMNAQEAQGLINAGTGEEIEIRELAQLIAKVVEYKGEITWDHSKPDGVFRKPQDSTKLKALGWKSTISLEAGLKEMYVWLAENYPAVRGIDI